MSNSGRLQESGDGDVIETRVLGLDNIGKLSPHGPHHEHSHGNGISHIFASEGTFVKERAWLAGGNLDLSASKALSDWPLPIQRT